MTSNEPGMPEKVPWRALVDEGVVLNQGRRSLLRTYRLRGQDLQASSMAEQAGVMWQLNERFKRFGGAWAIHDEMQRRRVVSYPKVTWAHPVPAFVDEIREEAILGDPNAPPATLEPLYYLTMRWRIPSTTMSRLRRYFVTNPVPPRSARGIPVDVERFRDTADHISYLLRGVLAVCEPLSSGELLTYLHGTVSDRWHPVAVPRDRTRLNHDLCDTPFQGGWYPRLGRYHLRLCSLTNYPEKSIAPALMRLDHLPFEVRRVHRLIAWDKVVARGVFRRVQHGWISQIHGPLGMAIQARGGQPKTQDSHAEYRAKDADAAQVEVSGDYVGYGHFTTVVMVWDTDPHIAEAKLATAQQIFEDEGFTVIVERTHSRQAFHSAVPGNITDSVRRKPMNTLSFVHWAAGMKAAWPGPEHNVMLREYQGGPPLFLAHTEGSTLFRVINHVHGVGHVRVLGPTGFGKTAMLDFISLRWAQYWPCQVFRFTVGGGEEAITRCVEGQYIDLGSTRTGSQPYRGIDDPTERAWAVGWTLDRLAQQAIVLNDTVRSFVTDGLEDLAGVPVSRRTITELVYALTARFRISEVSARNPNAPYIKELKEALNEQRHVLRALDLYTGGLLDGDHDDMTEGWYYTFEQETLLANRRDAPGVLTYRFHRLEQRLTGIPTVMEIDEATLPMVLPDYAEALPGWAMTKRKQFVSLILSTPLMTLFDKEAMRPLMSQSFPTTILTPNTSALEPNVAEVYRGMGLSETMIQQLAAARPALEYFYKSALGYRRFQLDLGGVLNTLCGSTNAPEEQALIQQILAEGRDEPFAVSWVRARGFPEEAERLRAHFVSTPLSQAAAD